MHFSPSFYSSHNPVKLISCTWSCVQIKELLVVKHVEQSCKMKPGHDCLLILILIWQSFQLWVDLAFGSCFFFSFHFCTLISAVRRKESQHGLIEFFGEWKVSASVHWKKMISLKKSRPFLLHWITISVTWAMASAITNLLQELLGWRCCPFCLFVCFLKFKSYLQKLLSYSLQGLVSAIKVKAANCYQAIPVQLRVSQQTLQRITWMEWLKGRQDLADCKFGFVV